MPENQVCPEGQHWDSNQSKCVQTVDYESPAEANPPELTQTATGDSVAADTGQQIQGESVSAMKVRVLKAERLAKTYEETNAELTEKLESAYREINEQNGIIKTQTNTISKMETQIATLNSEKSSDSTELKTQARKHNDEMESMKRRLNDITESRDGYKRIAEDKTALVEELTAKYKKSLETNVALNRDLTKTNEDYILLSKDLDRKEEALKKSKNLAGKIRAIGLNEQK